LSINYNEIAIPFLSNIELIVERDLKLIVIPIPNLRYQAHTEAYLSGDLGEINYDPAAPDVRIRFSIAHEVGHFVLHSFVISKLRSSSFEEWIEMQRTLPDVFWGRAEYQAREFAGRLLVPPQQLIEELRTIRPLIDKAKKIAPDLELPVIKELVSPKLAKRFAVSDDVIVRRMDAEQISPIQD